MVYKDEYCPYVWYDAWKRWVLDQCDGYGAEVKEDDIDDWTYCPWCGKKIDYIRDDEEE